MTVLQHSGSEMGNRRSLQRQQQRSAAPQGSAANSQPQHPRPSIPAPPSPPRTCASEAPAPAAGAAAPPQTPATPPGRSRTQAPWRPRPAGRQECAWQAEAAADADTSCWEAAPLPPRRACIAHVCSSPLHHVCIQSHPRRLLPCGTFPSAHPCPYHKEHEAHEQQLAQRQQAGGQVCAGHQLPPAGCRGARRGCGGGGGQSGAGGGGQEAHGASGWRWESAGAA